MSSNDIVIVSAVRTPFSKFGGIMKKFHSTELGSMVIKEALARAGVTDEDIDELYYGMCIQSEAALEYNVNGRQALLRAGLREDLVSLTIDRACCSSLTGAQLGFRAIKLGEADGVMSVGAENMSNTPVVINGHRWGTGMGLPIMIDHLNPIQYHGFSALAKDAGEVAVSLDITREIQDQWAVDSQQKYQQAFAAGKFKDEIMPVEVPMGRGKTVMFENDEFPKASTNMEGLAKLGTIYESPTVTAGNAPGLDAGAAALIIMKREKAEKLGLEPLATLLTVSSAAATPWEMAKVPAYATQKALKQTGISIDQVDLIEINEAFAAVPLVSTKILADFDGQKWQKLLAKTNVNGGAIAIGHPVGASGARILMTLMYELRRRGGGIGACSICGGLSQGDAAIIKVD